MRFTSLAGCYSFQLSGYSRYRFSPWQNDSHTRASRNERGWRKKGKKQTRYIVENTRSRSMPRRGANQSRDSGSILSIDLLPFVLPSEHPPFLPLCLFHPSPPPHVRWKWPIAEIPTQVYTPRYRFPPLDPSWFETTKRSLVHSRILPSSPRHLENDDLPSGRRSFNENFP